MRVDPCACQCLEDCCCRGVVAVVFVVFVAAAAAVVDLSQCFANEILIFLILYRHGCCFDQTGTNLPGVVWFPTKRACHRRHHCHHCRHCHDCHHFCEDFQLSWVLAPVCCVYHCVPHYSRFAGWCGVAMQIVVAFLWWTGIDLFGVSCSFDTN